MAVWVIHGRQVRDLGTIPRGEAGWSYLQSTRFGHGKVAIASYALAGDSWSRNPSSHSVSIVDPSVMLVPPWESSNFGQLVWLRVLVYG